MTKPRLAIAGSVLALLLLYFTPALSGRWSFAFRDAAHFYHPLFDFLRNEWLSWRLPLWNSYDNLGAPLAADNTSSVFYPGKLLFALPLSFTLLYNLYIVGHVALASFTSFRLARYFQASIPAAGLTSVSYAFCGNVLFGYCNVVFLVGAAWLPWGILLVDRALNQRDCRSAVRLGVVLALIVLGGDPQMAYNILLLGALAAILRWRDERRPAANARQRPGRRLIGSLGLMALAGCLAGLLAAVQILPTREFLAVSGRARYESPRSLYELAASVPIQEEATRPWYVGLLGTSPTGHQNQLYQFSVGPWRAIEFVWPNVGGRQFPLHRRWLSALPAEGRIWTPSLYLGLAPLLLAAASFSLRRTAPLAVRWLSWMALLTALGSLGGYGLVWIAREVAAWCGLALVPPLGDEVGGLYWLLTMALPGYVYFRYPAKLLVITSLALAVLAARGCDSLADRENRRLNGWLLGLMSVSLLALVAAVACRGWWLTAFAAAPADPLFGPLDVAGAWRDLAWGLAQTTLLCLVLLAVFRGDSTDRLRLPARWALVWITVVDLGVAQAWLVAYAPASAWTNTLLIARSLPANQQDYRVYREPNWLPPQWSRAGSSNRLVEAIGWDRETLRPKYHLPLRVGELESSATILSYDFQVLMDVARRHGPRLADGPQPHESVLDLLGVRVAILFLGSPSDPWRPLAVPAEGALAIERRGALPRTWIVHAIETLPRLAANTPTAVARRTEEVLFPAGQPRDWRHVAVVEADQPLRLPAMSPSPELAAREEACIVETSPMRVEIEARLATAGLLVLSDLDYPGWTVSVESAGQVREQPILRTNRVLRGVLLPAGEHRLVFRYRPRSVIWGGATSALAVLGLGLAAAFDWHRRKRTDFFGRDRATTAGPLKSEN